jgi:integrase
VLLSIFHRSIGSPRISGPFDFDPKFIITPRYADMPARFHDRSTKAEKRFCTRLTGETIGATWSEIDLEQTIPAMRMKAAREHRVPLSHRAVAILTLYGCRRRNPETSFSSARGTGNRSSGMPMLQALRGFRDGVTVHGMRSAFSDWCGDCTSLKRLARCVSLTSKATRLRPRTVVATRSRGTGSY